MKDLYNSILADIDNTIEDGDKEMDRISNTPRERFIKIISEAGGLSSKNINILRDLIEAATRNKKHNYISCFIPDKLKTVLIKKSSNKLTMADFKNFPKDNKEYSFRCSWDYTHLEALYSNGGYNITDIIKQAESQNGKPITLDCDGKEITCVKLNDVLAIQTGDLLYLKIDTYRLIVRMFNCFRVGFSIPLDV
jgi:hypothetical protein